MAIELRIEEEDGTAFEVEKVFIAVDSSDEPWFLSDDKARAEAFVKNWNNFIANPCYENYAVIMSALRQSLL